MFAQPYIQSELARVHCEELLREAVRVRLADQLPRFARPARTWSPATALSALATMLRHPAAARAT